MVSRVMNVSKKEKELIVFALDQCVLNGLGDHIEIIGLRNRMVKQKYDVKEKK